MGSRKGVPHHYSGNKFAGRCRVRYGLTQWQLALLLGVSRQRVAHFERGAQPFDFFQEEICHALFHAEGDAAQRLQAIINRWLKAPTEWGRTIYEILRVSYEGAPALSVVPTDPDPEEIDEPEVDAPEPDRRPRMLPALKI